MILKVFTQIFVLTTALLAPMDAHWSGESTSSSGHGKLSALDVICGKDHMTVRAEFAGPFHGTISSKGTYGQDNCVYIKPYSGVTHATFNVYYDRCGTKPDLQGKYYENTVVIQYGTDIIEAWDEAKRLRCEWFEAYEKPATFRPAIPVADLDVVEMNFQGDDIDCWMEIQEGKGPWGREVSRIVPVGQPMTIVIAINDYNGQFDMRVKSCFAHDGVKPPIHMTDEYGCVLRPKMLTKFNKVRDPNGKATVISYAHFYAFKFPDSMNVQIQCTVEVCRHGCPEACQKTPFHVPDHQIKQQTSLSYGSEHKRVADDKPERNSIDLNKDEENFGVESPDLQNSGSHIVPGHTVDVPQPPPPSPMPVKQPDTSAHQNFDSHRIPTPVYRASNRTSTEEKNEGKRDPNPELEEVNYEVDEKLEQESKLHEKVINMKPDEDSKPVISEKDLANLPTGTLDKAAQLFRDLGMNIDMSNLATGFVNGLHSKNLAQILDNDRIRELAESSGIKLGDQLKSPQVQPLVSSPLIGDENLGDAFVSSDDSESVKDGYLEVKDAEENAQKNADASGDKVVDVATASINEYWTAPVSTPSTSPSSGSSSYSSFQSTSSQSLSVPLSDAKKGQLDSNGSLNDTSSEPVVVSVRRPPQHPQHQLHQPPHPHRSPSSLVPEMAPPMRPPAIAVHGGPDVDHGRHPHQRNKQHALVNHRNKPIPVENEHIIHPHPQYPIHNLQQAQHLVAGNVQNPVAQIVNIPLAPFAIPPTFTNLMNSQQQVPPPPPPMPQHFGNRRNPIREQQHYLHPPQTHQPPPHRQPGNHYKPSLLASIGNHLPHFNLPSFLGSIQRQDNSPSPQPASSPNAGQVPSGMRQKRPILLANQINPFPQGPRSLRSRRSPSKEPIVSVKRGFQVVTSIDLSFMPNATDLPEIYSGRKEDIVYGVCMPINGLLVGLTLIFALILFALVSSFCFMRKLKTLRKQHQVS